ncbi:BPSL0067 family protein [Beijerinckia indica]|uniref:BPSL0067 family protein n=1 Tax=Beijerinckia indica TaxID=533 RepID=UPI001FCBFF00|nr:BPSL0067 family protein [Beijerinckia indica]
MIFIIEVSLMALAIGSVVGLTKSYADPALATQNGLPQVPREYVPEIGAPAMVYPTSPTSSDASSTGNSSSAGNSNGTGGSSGTNWNYPGTGSGVSGATVAQNYSSYNGQSVGSGECVALVQATSNVGLTSTWSPGVQVQGNTDIAAGTVIATFGSNGTYTNTYGQSHAAIYLGQNSSGIQVMDQWLGQAAQTRTIPWTTQNSYESGSQFYVVSH